MCVINVLCVLYISVWCGDYSCVSFTANPWSIRQLFLLLAGHWQINSSLNIFRKSASKTFSFSQALSHCQVASRLFQLSLGERRGFTLDRCFFVTALVTVPCVMLYCNVYLIIYFKLKKDIRIYKFLLRKCSGLSFKVKGSKITLIWWDIVHTRGFGLNVFWLIWKYIECRDRSANFSDLITQPV